MIDFFFSIWNFVTLGFLEFDMDFTNELIKIHEVDLARGRELQNLLNPSQIDSQIIHQNSFQRFQEPFNQVNDSSIFLEEAAQLLPELPNQVSNLSNVYEGEIRQNQNQNSINAPEVESRPAVDNLIQSLDFRELTSEMRRLSRVTILSSDDQLKIYELLDDNYRLHIEEHIEAFWAQLEKIQLFEDQTYLESFKNILERKNYADMLKNSLNMHSLLVLVRLIHNSVKKNLNPNQNQNTSEKDAFSDFRDGISRAYQNKENDNYLKLKMYTDELLKKKNQFEQNSSSILDEAAPALDSLKQELLKKNEELYEIKQNLDRLNEIRDIDYLKFFVIHSSKFHSPMKLDKNQYLFNHIQKINKLCIEKKFPNFFK